MTFENWFQSACPEIPLKSAMTVLRLAEEGATIPFIARYRKEATGNLNEVAIAKALEEFEKFTEIQKRQAYIVKEIEAQQKLTPELKEKILTTFEWSKLDDLFLPFKKKKKTKAALAKEAGLEPLADWIWNVGHGTEAPQPGQTLDLWSLTFRNEEKGIKDAESAIQGACDIIVERISEKQELRQYVRDLTFKEGVVKTGKGEKAKENSKYENYFSYHEPIQALLSAQASHRYLAIRRGWMEGEITLGVGAAPSDNSFEPRMYEVFEREACSVADAPTREVLIKCAHTALKSYVLSSIDNEVHRALKEVADQAAIKVFADNVRKLLMASPLGTKAVLGIDPGIKTGCKLAVVDSTGKYIGSAVIQLNSEEGRAQAKAGLSELLKEGGIQAIAIGNGTGGRETEIFVRALLKETGVTINVVMVSEAGASVYSASETAREEFPELDVTVRGAISIARRLQDPLAELVKIEPKSIGVGQYQHDVSQNHLKKSLELVVDSCVNSVGVNLNTASSHLLAHVSGIGPALAKNIVTFRGEKGLFKNRAQLKEVERFSEKAFEQAAGFLRIAGSDNILDNTGVHPERYSVLEKLAEKLNKKVSDFVGEGAALVKADPEFGKEVGEFTLKDIIQELQKPGRDPREEFVPFQFRDDIFELKDVQKEMLCPGIVTNVTNFGAFVDIGVHQDGLVHLSQLSHKFVKDPNDFVSPGDRVKVKVLEVNLEKKQMSLTMKIEPAEKRPPRPQQDPRPRQNGQQRAQGQGRPGGPPRGNRPQPPRPQRPSGPPRPQFKSNPFAALASLKDQLKQK